MRMLTETRSSRPPGLPSAELAPLKSRPVFVSSTSRAPTNTTAEEKRITSPTSRTRCRCRPTNTCVPTPKTWVPSYNPHLANLQCRRRHHQGPNPFFTAADGALRLTRLTCSWRFARLDSTWKTMACHDRHALEFLLDMDLKPKSKKKTPSATRGRLGKKARTWHPAQWRPLATLWSLPFFYLPPAGRIL
jgi:hypothetical protein